MAAASSVVRRSIRVTGAVDRPLALHFDELLQLPAVERRVQLVCTSGEISDVVMRGVALTHVFELARVRETACMAVFMCSDGYEEGLPLADLIQQEAFLVYQVDKEEEGEPDALPRLAVPGRGASKWAKGIHTIELS